MHKSFITLTLSLAFTSQFEARAQSVYEPFGSYLDLQGQLVHEYADQTYQPAQSIEVTFNPLTSYSPGIYYPPGGEAEKGLILYEPGKNNFYFKEDRMAEKRPVKPLLGGSVKIGADSFIVASDFAVYNLLGIAEKPVHAANLLQYMAKTREFTFYEFKPHTGKEKYVVRRHDTDELVGLPITHTAFTREASALFKNYPALIRMFENKDLTHEQVNQLIHFIQYSEAMEENKPIGYTANWEVTNKEAEQVYTVKVSQPEKNWKLDFYNRQGQLLFTEHQSYTYPGVVVEGEATWYYPESGVKRKETIFGGKTPMQTFFYYHPNGKLHYVQIINSKEPTLFKEIYSAEGDAMLDAKGNGLETFYDHAAGRTITREYKLHRLSTSWYTNIKGEKIYQRASRNTRIRYLQNFKDNIAKAAEYPEEDLISGTEGLVLIKVLVGPDKQILGYKLLQGPSNSINRAATNLLRTIYPGLLFTRGKHGWEKVMQEVLVSMRFSIQKEKKQHRFYYHDNSWMQQHQMMNQPTHINPPPLKIPTF